MKKVTFLKSHSAFSYFPGDEAELEATTAQKLIDAGYATAGKADSPENAQAVLENLSPEDQLKAEDAKAKIDLENPEDLEAGKDSKESKKAK